MADRTHVSSTSSPRPVCRIGCLPFQTQMSSINYEDNKSLFTGARSLAFNLSIHLKAQAQASGLDLGSRSQTTNWSLRFQHTQQNCDMASTPRLDRPESNHSGSPGPTDHLPVVSSLSQNDYSPVSQDGYPDGTTNDNSSALDHASIAERTSIPEPLTGTNTDDAVDHQSVASINDDSPVGKPLKRKVEWKDILADCVAVLLPAAMVAFIFLVWRLDGSHVVGDSHTPWLNAITVVSRRISDSKIRS